MRRCGLVPSTIAPTGVLCPATLSGRTTAASTSSAPAGLAPARESLGSTVDSPVVVIIVPVAIASRTCTGKTSSTRSQSSPMP